MLTPLEKSYSKGQFVVHQHNIYIHISFQINLPLFNNDNISLWQALLLQDNLFHTPTPKLAQLLLSYDLHNVQHTLKM